MWVLAPLRHRQFFSLAEANAALAEKIEEWNNRNNDIQLDIFYDYRTNLPLYSKVQEHLRKHQPPTLIVWGQNDFIFPADGAHPYKRDLTDLEFHLLDTGHVR
jgi:pimeloyl-ACP methyl ester carboxylesterase